MAGASDAAAAVFCINCSIATMLCGKTLVLGQLVGCIFRFFDSFAFIGQFREESDRNYGGEKGVYMPQRSVRFYLVTL